MPDPISATIGSAVIGGGVSLFGASKQAKAAKNATAAQTAAAQAGLAQQQAAYDEQSALFQPYVNSGVDALARQRTLAGLDGGDLQQSAIDEITNTREFRELELQGREGILAGASATGGLRGGNTQAALAQYRPSLLNSLIDKQYSRLGGFAASGQNAAARAGGYAGNFANNSTQLLNAQGNALSQGSLATGQAYANGAQGFGNALSSGLGAYSAYGANGSGGLFSVAAPSVQGYIPTPTARPGGF